MPEGDSAAILVRQVPAQHRLAADRGDDQVPQAVRRRLAADHMVGVALSEISGTTLINVNDFRAVLITEDAMKGQS